MKIEELKVGPTERGYPVVGEVQAGQFVVGA